MLGGVVVGAVTVRSKAAVVVATNIELDAGNCLPKYKV